jgi:hypothetical protein
MSEEQEDSKQENVGFFQQVKNQIVAGAGIILEIGRAHV